MAPRIPRRPRAADDPEDPDEPVRLDDEAHAWWAQRPAEALLRERRPPPPPPPPPRDILAEHFGPDWRTSWGFEPSGPPVPAPHEPPPPAAPTAMSGFAAPPLPVIEDPPVLDGDAAPPSDGDEVPGEHDPVDAYGVLGVQPTATWEQIVAAHRAMARRHHPDRVASSGSEAVATAAERIRQVNAAYAELRIRRGR